ncbi:hypothetical protein ACFLS1_07185, partial [Verrucomicrobiota bacterium]
MQRRWAHAIVFSVLFLLCFIVFIVYAIQVILAMYSLAWDFEATEINVQIPKQRMIVFFGLAMVIYLVSLVDTYLAYMRAYRERAIARFNDEIPKYPRNEK